jgi:hypothetical protein
MRCTQYLRLLREQSATFGRITEVRSGQRRLQLSLQYQL